ncbi:hypothetical protein RAS1_19170 [Phycisphaerae bacterium RAS1]|nr:hypothetical protein RAS1_19170 [Phycisphaerae bacterium RAS1]
MQKSEKRFVYWDGVCNVDPATGRVDTALSCKEYLESTRNVARERLQFNPKDYRLDAAPAPALAQGGTKTVREVLSAAVIPDIKVRIKRVDEWFVPIVDLLAIEVRLRFIKRIKSMMLRVFNCGKDNAADELVYQETFDRYEVEWLSYSDYSHFETSDVKDRRKRSRDRVKARVAPCLSHCRVELWIADKDKAFAAFDGKTHPDPANFEHDKSVPKADVPDAWAKAAQGWQQGEYEGVKSSWKSRIEHKKLKHADNLGKNLTLVGCPLVESIMAGTTSIRVFDTEPLDSAWHAGKKTGLGVRFDNFRVELRDALYGICSQTKIGTALLRAVANENPAKSVSCYPVDTVYHSIGGCAMGSYTFSPAGTPPKNVDIKDDFDAYTHIDEVKTAIKAGAIKQSDDPAWRPADVWDAQWAGQPLEYAGRRYAFRQIGASTSGRGCKSKFYFNMKEVKNVAAGEFKLLFHESTGECSFTLKPEHNSVAAGENRRVVAAAMTKDAGGNERSVETPLFLALAHEMIHARRLQLGMNCEWDMIDGDFNELRHPSNMVAQMKAQIGTNGLTEEIVRNLVSRYQPYNREEWDTIEGFGAPVVLDEDVFKDLVSKRVIAEHDKTGRPNEVRVTENLMRKELGLNPRYRYVDAPTTNAVSPAMSPELNARINAPNKLILGVQTPDIGSNIAARIREETDKLIEQDGGMAHRELVTMKPESIYFVRRGARFSLAKRFKSNAKLPDDDRLWDVQDKNYVDGVFDNIVKAESGVPGLSVEAAQKLADLKNQRPTGTVTPQAKGIWVDNKLVVEANKLVTGDVQTIVDKSEGRLEAVRKFGFANRSATAGDKALIYNALLADEPGTRGALTGGGQTLWDGTKKPTSELSQPQKGGWVDSLIPLGPTMDESDRKVLIDNSVMKLQWKANAFAPKMGTFNPQKKADLYDALLSNDSEIQSGLSGAGKLAYNGIVRPTGAVTDDKKAEWVTALIGKAFTSDDINALVGRSNGGLASVLNLKVAGASPDVNAKAGVYDTVVAKKSEILGALTPDGKLKIEGAYNAPPPSTFTYPEKARHVLRFLQTAFWFNDEDMGVIVNPVGKFPKVQEAISTDAACDCFAGYNMDARVAPVDDQLGREANPSSKAAAYLNPHWATDPIENVRHALVHEPMHMFAAGGTGFTEWDVGAGTNGVAFKAMMETLPGGNPAARLSTIKSVMDEGACEMFCRIISYRINHAENARLIEVTRLEACPYYEWPVHLVCQIVRDLKHLKGDAAGFQLVAKAYFDGAWGPFNDALWDLKAASATYGTRYTDVFWQYVGDLQIGNDPFRADNGVCDTAVKKFRTDFGVQMMRYAELTKALDDGVYHDPVCFVYVRNAAPADVCPCGRASCNTARRGEFTYQLTPVACTRIQECCKFQNNQAATKAERDAVPRKKVATCLRCKKRINFPDASIFK